LTKKEPFIDNNKNFRTDKEIIDDGKFVDAIPIEELKKKISKEKQHPLTESAISSEEDFPYS
jgi:hypothetical protein